MARVSSKPLSQQSSTQLHNIADRMDTKRAQVEAYTQEIIEEQRAIYYKLEKFKAEVNDKLESLRYELQPYVDGDKMYSDRYHEMVVEYEEQLLRRARLESTMELTRESIAEGQIHGTGLEGDNAVSYPSKA